ncbi:hypothetical protein GCM10007857_70420 [Bradyrhizobium iriomotense]|uniref:Uncharacterized protein n=1 Tax=Bradyrhizobium iriomotense TaxID=441950 RepID=A0ABQ6B8H1_9BRAD|nr:hypothetical protein GCM10007857_70420 [Bradyrhizobium iriomotense]
MPWVFTVQKLGKRACEAKTHTGCVRRSGFTHPLQYQLGGYYGGGSFAGEYSELIQRLLVCIELLAKGAMQLNVAIDVMMDHDAAPGQGWATAASIETSTFA